MEMLLLQGENPTALENNEGKILHLQTWIHCPANLI